MKGKEEEKSVSECTWGLSGVQGGLLEHYTRCENDFCNMSYIQQTAGDFLFELT